MPRFEIYSEKYLVGWSELELGDAPMAIAFGKFTPAPGYSKIRTSVVAAGGIAQAELHLSVRTPDGDIIECLDVIIADYSADLGSEGLEVTVLGIVTPSYEQLFPHHVAAYERQFPSGS